MTRVRPPKPIPLRAWKKTRTQGFIARRDDLRQLLMIVHPWIPSQTGGFGAWEATVTPPAGWHPREPLYVSFYQSDNYSGTWHESAWTGTQAFIGHRFKQLLVNGRLVWEQDVADEEMADPTALSAEAGRSGYHDPYRVVEITKYAGDQIILTVRVVDKVASTTRLSRDVYKRFSWSAFDPNQAMNNFQTSVYFGDVSLTMDNQVARPAEQPAVPTAPGRRRKRSVLESGIPFTLVTPGRLPAPGYPVRSGVPMPTGSVLAGTSFALRDPHGNPIPLITTELSHWPDGSVRWLLCEFVATGEGRYRLIPDAKPALPAQPVRIESHDEMITVTNGLLTLRVGQQTGEGVYEGISCATGLDLGRMDLSIKLNRVGWRDHFTAHRRGVVIERSSPVCAVVRVEGDLLDEQHQRFGPWRVRLHIWAGLHYLLVDWRLVNESDQAMAMLLDWSARVRLPGLENAVVDFGPFTPGYDPDDIGVKAMGHHGVIERTGIRAPRLGHREYWDTAWSNDYRGRTHLGLIQYIETGSPQWFRYFDAACTHTRDVDIIHFCPEHPDWVGATHSYGEDHTSCGPMGNIGLNCDGLLDHYLLTGDPESLKVATGLAEHLLQCDPWGRSARNVGWPLAQVIRWYDQTGDPRFLAKARDLMEAIRAYVEPRRGIFDEIHGCWNYRGTVPFMTGYLAFGLIRYHQCTAAAEALNLLRCIAAGLFAESRTARGRFRYSPFPENNYPTDRSRSWNALVGGLVGYLFDATGEPRYAEWARECYEGIVEQSDEPQVSMDMLHLAGWMLHAVVK